MDWLERIKTLKKEKGFTNDTLAERSGIPLGTLNKLLSGASSDPKLSTLVPLAEVLGCSMDELLGRAEPQSSALPADLAEKYAELDDEGRTAVSRLIEKEYTRVMQAREDKPYALDLPQIRRIRLYNTAVSAGTGSFLADGDYTEIPIYANEKTDAADFAVRVYGNSMQPRYADGDILLVSKSDEIDVGELGIFALNGESYFKKFGGDRLISLNPDYRDIRIGKDDEILCFGRVIGRLKK